MMFSAILLAGYDNKRKVEKYRSIVSEDYGEDFIETGYKPLREFAFYRDGQTVRKPLMQFTLEALAADTLISEIVIVGFTRQIRERLASYLATLEKPVIFVDQRDEIPRNIVNDFSINLKKTPKDSVGGNFIKGYAVSRACKNREHALFVASDSPLTTPGFIDRFIDMARGLLPESSIIMPAIFMDPEKDDLGRRPLLLVNDTGYPIHTKKDKYGRNGFRLSSLLFCNPFRLNVNSINVVYSVRKALSPGIQIRIQKICKSLGYQGILSSYFSRHTLSFRQGEAITGAFLEGVFRGLPMPDVDTTYDFDGTRREYSEIEKMLAQKVENGNSVD